jgi:hypothetical protein
MDFIVGMPTVAAQNTFWALPGHDHLDTICTVSCKFSKKTILIAGHSTYTAKGWATVFLRMLHLCDWGIPKAIISDRDPKFTSDFWRALHDLLDVRLLLSTAYHPQTDGLSERKNQTVEIAIRFHYFDNPDIPWTQVLPALQHHLNNTLAITIGRSPNELVMGFKPRSILDVLNDRAGQQVPHDIARVLRQEYQQEAAELVAVAGLIAKERYDDKHTPAEFKAGDVVYLRLGKGYQLPGKPPRKWSPQRAGPFTVQKRIGSLAVELDFPATWRVHPVVSVAHVWKPAQGTDPFQRRVTAPGPVELVGGGNNQEAQYEVDRLVDRRIVWHGKRPEIQYLVRWTGYEAKDDWWRSRSILVPTAGELVDDYDAKHGPITDDLIKAYKMKKIPLPRHLSALTSHEARMPQQKLRQAGQEAEKKAGSQAIVGTPSQHRLRSAQKGRPSPPP